MLASIHENFDNAAQAYIHEAIDCLVLASNDKVIDNTAQTSIYWVIDSACGYSCRPAGFSAGAVWPGADITPWARRSLMAVCILFVGNDFEKGLNSSMET